MAKVPQISTTFYPDVTMPEPEPYGSSDSPEDGPLTSPLDTGRQAHFPGRSPTVPFSPVSGFMTGEHEYPRSSGQFDSTAQPYYAHQLSPPPHGKLTHHSRKGSDGSIASATTPQQGLKSKSSALVPRAETGLMHIDIPRKFGEAGEYWKRYDDVSEHADKDFVEMLNANLDILLIFSGLFSGVNTAFLCLSLLSLSPDSNGEMVRLLTIIAEGRQATGNEVNEIQSFDPGTQVVRVNCFWVASLTCSLLASAGAMLGKQWVVYYTRDPPGTLEAQGRARQRRFNGAEKWRFRYIVELLPLLIQCSLLIFCIGLIDYFYALNPAVSWVVLALTASGLLFYVSCLLASILDPDCPFRSFPSVFALKVFGLMARWGRRARRRSLKFYFRHERQLGFMHSAIHAIHDLVDRVRGIRHEHTHDGLKEMLEQEEEIDDGHDHGHGGSKIEDGKIDGQTACWMIETSEHETALLTAARNIPALHVVQGSRLNVKGLAFHRLLSLFRESLTVLAACNGPGWNPEHSKKALESSLIYGRALGHVVVGSGVKRNFYGHFRGLQWPTDWKTYQSGFASNELILLKYCLYGQIPKNFCAEHQKNTMPHSSAALSIYIAALLEPSEELGEKFRVAAAPIDRISLVQRLMAGSFAAADPYATALLSLNAWALGHLPDLVCGDKDHTNINIRKKWWKAYTSDDHLYPNIIRALDVFHYYQRLVSAFHGHAHVDPHDHGHHSAKKDTPTDLLAPTVWYSTYISLLRCTRDVIDYGSRHQETLAKYCFKLDAALRRVDVTVARLRDPSKTGDPLNKLQDEIHQLIQTIRIDGQLAMVKTSTPRSAASSTESLAEEVEENPHNLDDEGIYVVTPITLTHIEEAIKKEKSEEDILFAALSLCLDQMPNGSLQPNISTYNFNDLTKPLTKYLEKEDSIPLLSKVISRLVGISAWRDAIEPEQGANIRFVKEFKQKTQQMLHKHPKFAILEASLDVWHACHVAGWDDVSAEWETEEFAQLVDRTMKRISHDQHAASHHGHDHAHDHDPEDDHDHDDASHEKEVATPPTTHARLFWKSSNGTSVPKAKPTPEVMNVPQPYIPYGLGAYVESQVVADLRVSAELQKTYNTFVTLKDASWWVFHEK